MIMKKLIQVEFTFTKWNLLLQLTIIFATFLPYLAAKYIIPYLLVGARQLRLGLF